MSKASIKILAKLLITGALIFLIKSKVLGSLTWIAWIGVLMFSLYNTYKMIWDFGDSKLNKDTLYKSATPMKMNKEI